MKRRLLALLAGAVMVIVAGCAPATEDAACLRRLYSWELSTLNYLTTSRSHELTFAANCIGTLVEFDAYGTLGPGLAETWTQSDDGLIWTFTLREGLAWVDSEGREVAPLTAQDFVDSAQYVLERANASATANILYRVIDGAEDYFTGQTSDFSSVGVWAPDSRTVCYRLKAPAPYFLTMLTYGCFMPVQGDFLREQGTAFGRDERCVLYSGAYVLAEFSPQSGHLYQANPAYWDRQAVYIPAIREIYNKDAASLEAEMFRRGEVDMAQIPTALMDDWLAGEETSQWVFPGREGNFTYFYAFNFHVNLPEEYEPENWEKAVNNVNFRRAIAYGLNRVKLLSITEPDGPERLALHTLTPQDFAYVDGVDYTQLGPLEDISAREPYQPQTAQGYAALARAQLEAQGVHFPVKVLMPYHPSDAGWALEAQVAKQQLEELLGSDFIEVVLEAGPSTGFISAVRVSGRYCLMKCNWGPDYADPETYTDPFLPAEGGFNAPELAEEYLLGGTGRYETLLAQAQAQTESRRARYEAFARAEAFLIDEALVIPYARGTGSYWACRVNPLEGAYSPFGLVRYKGMRLYDEPLTRDDYGRALEAWRQERSRRLREAEA